MKNILQFLFIVLFNIHLIYSQTNKYQDLTFTEIWGSLPLQTGGHGVFFADANNDGNTDIYISFILSDSTTISDFFLLNLGQNQFSENGSERGIMDQDAGSHGAAWADLNNDGNYDLINGTTFTNSLFSNNNNIYQNNGNAFFSEVTPQILLQRKESTRAFIAFDMDKDGDLDLFGVTNFQGSNDPPGENNEVYINNSDFQFSEITSGDLYTAPAGQGAIDTDFDGDGDIDVMAANRTGPVNILLNDGSGNFSLTSPGNFGITHNAGDGISTADIDNDGDLDLLLSGDDNGELYNNNSNSFIHKQSFTATDGYMGGFGDLDNDGDVDLVFAGDDVCYLNDGAGNFSTGPTIPVTGISDPRGVSFSDIDNDGDLDFVFGAKGSRNYLFQNELNSGNWLRVKLISPQGQAGAFGSKTFIYQAGQIGGSILGFRESKSNYGYVGQDDPILHFGLGSNTSVDVKVIFLDGQEKILTNVTSNQVITVDGTFTSAENNSEPLINFKLFKNYPNPFNPSTTISYFLPSENHVTLKIVDPLGNEITTLVYETKQRGKYEVVFNGRNLSSGLYFYRFEAGDYSDTGKMILLK